MGTTFLFIYNKIMILLWFIAWTSLNPCYSQQPYDISSCSSSQTSPGSRYTCNSSTHDTCKTFLVYRSNHNFQTISQISNLFNKTTNEVLHINNLTASSQILKQGKEVLIPIECTCSGQFYQAKLTYKVLDNTQTFSSIACEVFEGLLKYFTLSNENQSQGNSNNEPKVGDELYVPLRCACPQNFSSMKSVIKYFVTYPLIEGDTFDKLKKKFGFSLEDFFEANQLQTYSSIFPMTVVLIPLQNENGPIEILDIPDSPSPPPDFLPTNPFETQGSSTQTSNLYIAGPIIGFFLFITLVASGLYMKKLKQSDVAVVDSFNPTNSTTLWSPITTSTTSCLSPDFLVGLKYCLLNYHIEEIEKATKFFSDVNKIGEVVYKGLINDIEVMIKRLRFEETSKVIDLHSRINHINIVNLIGVCYGEGDLISWSYLVFELPKNGCLRDCLLDPCNTLNWYRRTQIVFDIATCLYYLHYCSSPSYAHMNVNSRNIFVTENWRGKLADVGGVSNNVLHGNVSQKVDIFAFGVVLLELISGREKCDGKLVKDCVGFLLGEGSEGGGCFEGLRSFVDPNLKDYSLPEALCLCFLAKDCVKDDPMHRPTMDDIMKVLAKMV